MWLNFDALGMLQQVGAVPSPGEVAKKQRTTIRVKKLRGKNSHIHNIIVYQLHKRERSL